MSPRLRLILVTLASVSGLALTVSLGHWQLRRAAYKEALQAQALQRGALPVLSADALVALDPASVKEQLQRRTVVQGTWLPQHTVALDNRQMLDKQGFFILTPLQLQPSGDLVLVQRGWLPRNFQQRDALLPYATPDGTVNLQATIALGPARLYAFDGRERGPIRQNLDLGAFARETGLPLREFMLVQQGPSGDGLLREWTAPSLGIERHYGYAFQWFSLAVLIAGLYLWFQWMRPMRRVKEHVSDGKP